MAGYYGLLENPWTITGMRGMLQAEGKRQPLVCFSAVVIVANQHFLQHIKRSVKPFGL